MGSINDWDDDDSIFDWGSQFGGSSGTAKSTDSNKASVVHEPEPKEEQPPVVPETPVVPVETDIAPVETDADLEPLETVQDTHSEPPKDPLKREEVEEFALHQKESAEKIAVHFDRFQQMMSLCEASNYPKSVNVITSHFIHLLNVARASKALADYYLETDETLKFQTLEDSKLMLFSKNTSMMIQSYDSELETALGGLEERIKQGESRHLLNLGTQAIKAVTGYLDGFAERQAKAYSEALDAYSPTQGSLVMLERFAHRGDREVMASIDHTLNLAGTDLVLTEDAPAMMEALERNDTDTIIRLQQKLIDHLFEKQ